MRINYLSLANIKSVCRGVGKTGYIAGCRDSILICKLLYRYGIISGYSIQRKRYSSFWCIEICLKQRQGMKMVSGILIKSHPVGRVVYKIGRILRIYTQDSNLGIFRTNRGILSSKKVIQRNIGGECLIHSYSL
jgi:ribosomal protein S8